MGTQLLQWEGADIFWLIIFFLSVGLFNLDNYKYIVALLHFIPVYSILCNESVHSKTSFNCDDSDMYYFTQSLAEYLFIYCKQCKVSIIVFLLNSVNNWFCNRDNSIVLFVALPHLLYMYIYIYSLSLPCLLYIYILIKPGDSTQADL